MKRLMLPVVIVALIVGGAWLAFGPRGRAALPGEREASLGTAVAAAAPAVIADGRVLPAADVSLAFERPGTLAELLVGEGDLVAAGQPLARLDDRALALRVEQAQVGLARAEARYAQVLAGASPEAQAVAEAGVGQAQAALAQSQAVVSPEDLAAARAQLAEAQAGLAALLDGPKATELAQAEAALDQAGANLAQQRDALSAAKTNAGLQVDQAASALQNRQDEYSRIYWENRDLERLPGDLPQARVDLEAAALRAVGDAEARLAQAQVSYEQARQAEVEGLAAAEARVREAQARLDQLLAPADADRIAAAQARVAQAQASLAALSGPERATQIGVAAAGVGQAQAALAQAAAPPRAVDLEAARVEIDAARVALAQAELELDQATLYAPFAGSVVEITMDAGGLVGPGGPAIVLADLSQWRVETEDLSELDVVRLRAEEPALVSFDALPGLELPGRIAQIKPLGKNRQGDIVYTVVVELERSDPRLRWNMTAVVNVADPAAGE